MAQLFAKLKRYADRNWYGPTIGLLAGLDNLIIIVPTDGILISSSMLKPHKWFSFALATAIGSTLGGLALAALVELQGLPWIIETYPGMVQTTMWTLTNEFFHKYGLWVVFIVAISPVLQHPAIVLAALADTPLMQLAGVLYVGRFAKFLLMAYVGSHAPRLLSKMWGVAGELKDVGVEVGTEKTGTG
jgi:membrane protein YqaA with SNARE-associated domain